MNKNCFKKFFKFYDINISVIQDINVTIVLYRSLFIALKDSSASKMVKTLSHGFHKYRMHWGRSKGLKSRRVARRGSLAIPSLWFFCDTSSLNLDLKLNRFPWHVHEINFINVMNGFDLAYWKRKKIFSDEKSDRENKTNFTHIYYKIIQYLALLQGLKKFSYISTCIF